MKTIKELNDKWWYRLIKVIFVLGFILTVLITSAIVFSTYGKKKVDDYVVFCNYGNKEIFAAWEDKKIYISSYDLQNGIASLPSSRTEEIQKVCDISEKELTDKLNAIFEGTDDSKPLFNIIKSKVEVGSTFKAILYSILGLFIITIIFQIIRKIFYYIVLGSIKPDKI